MGAMDADLDASDVDNSDVEVYLDGPSLLAALDESATTPHLLLSDVVLPRMAGPDLAQELVRRHPQVRVPPGGDRTPEGGRDRGRLRSGAGVRGGGP